MYSLRPLSQEGVNNLILPHKKHGLIHISFLIDSSNILFAFVAYDLIIHFVESIPII